MGADETVKIRVNIDIQSASTYDTGLTVAEWNALPQAERARMAHDYWDIEAAKDNGGTWVENDDALEC